METAALCKPIQRSADLLRIPGTWVLTGLGKLLAVLGSFPQFRTASTTASHTSFWRFLECQSIEATLTQNGHLTHHEIPSVASLRPGGHFPRIGWPVSPEYAVGVFLIIAGYVALLTTFWEDIEGNRLLRQFLLFLSLFLTTGLFFSLACYMRVKYAELEASSNVVLIIVSLLTPLVFIAAVLITLVPA